MGDSTSHDGLRALDDALILWGVGDTSTGFEREREIEREIEAWAAH